jgi:hypothetical protein
MLVKMEKLGKRMELEHVATNAEQEGNCRVERNMNVNGNRTHWNDELNGKFLKHRKTINRRGKEQSTSVVAI